ncbi:Glycerate dehydrogenase [Cytospora mali]|uniref:Glycerate dehydrogenase n=1 Tax=Cytospora mali TaxID=578113 RepID=A0A194VCQ2_CYTMA|nr:Glycerate dehydrogenase [Valsa mali var. pyri (nom. inval.)]
MTMPSEQTLHPKQLPSDTHEVIVVLESIHVPWEDFDSSPKTHEILLYKNTNAKEEDDVIARIRDASIVICTICNLPAETLKHAPYLQHNIQVMNSTNCNTESVAEHAIALYLATRRTLIPIHNALTDTSQGPGHTNEWKSKGSMNARMRDGTGAPPRTCTQETVGVVGHGAVGRHIARLCRALGMEVNISERKSKGGGGEDDIGHPSSSSGPPVVASEYGDGASGSNHRLPFTTVLSRSTIIFLSLPLTSSTANTISTPELALMRPDSIIINVSRGGIVDEPAIVQALTSRQIFGYGTDVFAREPAGGAEDSVLLSPEVKEKGLNLTLTGHLAWFSATTLLNQVRRVKENLRAYRDGDEAWGDIVVGRRKV